MAPRRRVKVRHGRPELVGVAGSGARANEDGCGPERVLLVDDREDNLMALEAVLEPLGYELLAARSGQEALRILLGTDVSAIVLDVQMPDMDGFETAALLKSREATRTIPVLFLTAVGLSLQHELRGYEVGGTDYICKPFEPRVLQAKVRAAVRWGSELRALRRASRVYQEAAEALAAVPRTRPPRRRRMRRSPVHVAAPLVTTRRVDLGLEATVSAPAAARAAIREALVDEPDERVDVTVLLVSELLANAVVHAGTGVRLRLDVGSETLRVEVEDAGTQMPDPVVSDQMAEGGRGWLMVEQLADRCGWNRLDLGKSVWFELCR
jgi:DNA-binding response OmpR family regulator/anti-sigma regulatory factor (Ser/Thr protein kinase)